MILVAGGNGFVGRPLCERLFERGAQVLSLDLFQEEGTKYLSLAGDVADGESLGAIFDRYPIHTVVNLAAILVSDSIKDPAISFRVNVVGSFNLLDICCRRGVSRFVFGSSYNALGDLPNQQKEPIDETAATQPSDFYGETKRFVEQIGVLLSRQYGFQFVAARMPMIVGPGEPTASSAWRAEMFNKISSGGSLFIDYAPEEVLPLAHQRDMADALAALVLSEKLRHTIYHLPYEAWRVADLGETLNQVGHDLNVTYGERRFCGAPASVSWARIQAEFGLQPPSLLARLREQKTLTGKNRMP